MKRKRSQRWLAMLLAAAMFASTIESTGLAQTLEQSITTASETEMQQKDANAEETAAQQEEKREIELPERVKKWEENYVTVFSQDEAEALRTDDDSAKILIAAKDCELAGLTFGEMVSVDTGTLKLSEITGQLLDVEGSTEVYLYGTVLEQLYIKAEENETVYLHMDADTQIPEIILKGSGEVCIEGNSSLGMVEVNDSLEKVTVRATCSVLNNSKGNVVLETTDGNEEELQSGEQKEVTLSAYLITFMADGQIYRTETVKPGEIIPYPEADPEKEGYIFTSWYTDEEFTETCSQFAAAEGQMTFYARFIEGSEGAQVTFNSMGGRELDPLIVAKGETLLARPVSEIYTEKEGFTFGGWCVDEECTTAFSYTEPIEEDITLYAFFVSDEVQEMTQDGNIASFKDFDWQDSIALRTDTEMTVKEVEKNVSIQAGTGELVPEVDIEESEDGYVICGSYYEADGACGFEPGATFTVVLSGDVHFADYPDETNTAVVSVYKEQREIVGFSEDMAYVLWDDVLEYVPVTTEDSIEDTASEAETEPATEEVSDEEENYVDNDGEKAEEFEAEPYLPGTILVKSTTQLQEGDLVAFYDGEIGRDEKNIESYTEGSLDGYVLYAQILSVEQTDEGTVLTYGYASPEEYLADFDVHITDNVMLEDEISEADRKVLTARLSNQVKENEELKAQMLVAVMSASETQDMLDDIYGEGVYALAGMTASMEVGNPEVELTVSGSEATASISISATAQIKKDGKVMLTVEPKLAFTQAVEVKLNVDGGKVWIDMSVSVRSTSKIELTVTASSGNNIESASVFTEAVDSFKEIVKPEGIQADEYEAYDESISDLMETMSSIVSTSLPYTDIFDILLLRLNFSFYGIVTVGFEVHLVGQIGVLATFGVEIIATSGEKIGFKYNFLKFKGSSYTEKLESGVTQNIYLVGKLGVRVGLRLVLSVTMCAIASAQIKGEMFVYAELAGFFFNTLNMLNGANSSLGALHFEVGIDVAVSLGLKVNLIFKTIGKSWTVYKGRWPLWSTSISNKLSYVAEEKLEEAWKEQAETADHRTTFGFNTIPMKTWNLIDGSCTENQLLSGKSAGKGAVVTLAIENLIVNGETVGEDNPKNGLFKVGDAEKGENPTWIYMDEDVVAEELCEEAELDLVLTYENNSSSALVKKQEMRFHLKKKCALATTTHNVKVVLQDWCARNWDIQPAEWDNAVVYETSFRTTHMLGQLYEPTATGMLPQGEVIAAAQAAYPQLAELTCQWSEPIEDGSQALMQYSNPKYSNFCYMTPENGLVRYDVKGNTESYDVTYCLYVRRFEGFEDTVRYHINVTGAEESDVYRFTTAASENGETLQFERQEDGSYLLEAKRGAFDMSEQPLMMSVNEEAAVQTGFVISGQEIQQDVYFDISLGTVMLGIQLGSGVVSYEYVDPSIVTEEGVKAGTRVQLKVKLQEGYGGLEAFSTNENAAFTVKDDIVSFIMPLDSLTVTLQAYKLHKMTYHYNYKGKKEYMITYFAENQITEQAADPTIDGLTFRGWYTSPECEGEAYTFGTNLQTDVALYADWTCDVTVHFTPAKGKASYLIDTANGMKETFFFENHDKEYYKFTYSTLRVGEKLLNIQIPEYEGYQFMDWYTNADFEGNPVDLETYVLKGGVHLYARWAKEVPVIFYVNDGSDETENPYFEMIGFTGYPLTMEPDEPTREYYTFTGWYKDKAAAQKFDMSADAINKKTNLYAGWEAVSYSISYDLGTNGINAASNPESYTTENRFTLADPTRTGYTFVGWMGTGLDEVSKEVIVLPGNGGSRTYTAVWKPITYSITYKRTHGTATENPVSYTIESPDITLAAPTREGYTFEGWISDGQTTPEKTVVIPSGSTGSRSYTAVWTTNDPILQILENVEELAERNPYEGNLEEFLGIEEIKEGSADHAVLQENLRTSIEALLKDLIKAEEDLKSYSDNITILAEYKNSDLTVDSQKQKYTYQITVSYLDDNGEQQKSEIFDYAAELYKLVPTVTWPTAGKLKYGERVSKSTLTNGSAVYSTADHVAEDINVAGYFAWDTEAENKIPFGRSNHTEENSYKVVFTPKSTELFAAMEGSAGVLTQIGVAVSCTTSARDYIPGYCTADAEETLVYVDKAGIPTTEVCDVENLLNVEQVNRTYADDQPAQNKVAACSGYRLNTEANKNSDSEGYGSDLYVFVDAMTNTAVTDADYKITTVGTIQQVVQGNEKLNITAPTTKQTSYEYETVLADITFTAESGMVQYQADAADPAKNVTIAGTWSWQRDDLEQTPAAGETVWQAVFTPDEQYGEGYGSFTADVTVTVTKKTVNLPAVINVTYNGSEQTAQVTDTDSINAQKYTVEPCTRTNAGNYEVKVKLKDSSNYRWQEGSDLDAEDSTEAKAVLDWTIQKADVEVTVNDPSKAMTTLMYGQKLTSADTDSIGSSVDSEAVVAISARGNTYNIRSGYTATYDGISGQKNTVDGTWSWIVDENGKLTVADDQQGTDLQQRNQPLDGYAGEWVKAKFTPKDDSLNSCEAYLPVEVVDSVPYVGTSPTPKPFFVPISSEEFRLGYSGQINEGVAYNRYTGERINGTWYWTRVNTLINNPFYSTTADRYTTATTERFPETITFTGTGKYSTVTVESEVVVKTTVNVQVYVKSDVTVGADGVGLNVNPGESLKVYDSEVLLTSSAALPDIAVTVSDWTDNENTALTVTKASANWDAVYKSDHSYGRWPYNFDEIASDIKVGRTSELGSANKWTYMITLSESLDISPGNDIVINLHLTAKGYSTTALALLDDPEAAPVMMDTEPETEESECTTENATVPSETGTTEASTEGQTNAEESTESSTEGQTAVTESEKQTEDTEPATEGQTTLPETEKQTETAEPSTEGQTQPSQTESQTETSAPQTEKQSETDAVQPESEKVTEKQSETAESETKPSTEVQHAESQPVTEKTTEVQAETVQTEPEKGTVGKE